MTVPTARVVVPAPERERRSRQGREVPELPARASWSQEPVTAPPGTAPGNAPQVVVLAGEDEDACRREPHIWRGID
ncbi:hypothetical protein [Streptomyces sp. NPDC047042]|uniref:hypothetical protein n=1 Tax=Streptomyces sp. NPDC047042 TaxID=3154807 RepID=UPI0034099162